MRRGDEKGRSDNKVRSDEKEEKTIQRRKGKKEKSLVSYPEGN